MVLNKDRHPGQETPYSPDWFRISDDVHYHQTQTVMKGVFRYNPGRKCTLWVGGIAFKNCTLRPTEDGTCYVDRPGRHEDFLIYSADKDDRYGDNQKYTSIEIFPLDFLLPEDEFKPEPKTVIETQATAGIVSDYGITPLQEKKIRSNGIAGLVAFWVVFMLMRVPLAYGFCVAILQNKPGLAAFLLFAFIGISFSQDRVLLIVRIILRNK